jgi:hypothetical protein
MSTLFIIVSLVGSFYLGKASESGKLEKAKKIALEEFEVLKRDLKDNDINKNH